MDQTKKKPLLTDDVLQILKEKNVDGEVFLIAGSCPSLLQHICGLSPETAVVLSNLSRELAKEESKLLSFMSCTPRRQQTNNVTANRQQAENVEMSTAADSAGKSTDHAPLLFSYANPYYCRVFNSQSVCPLRFTSKVDYGLPSRIP